MSETCAEFRVKYLGAVEKLDFEMSKTLKEPLDLISYIDAAQVMTIFRIMISTLCLKKKKKG